eukprot:scaffold573_cov414-Prasinococcus_capsulatus_cf.AAC.1
MFLNHGAHCMRACTAAVTISACLALNSRRGRPTAARGTALRLPADKQFCTFVSLDLPTLRLDIVGVAAGVGMQDSDARATDTVSELLSSPACLRRLGEG